MNFEIDKDIESMLQSVKEEDLQNIYLIQFEIVSDNFRMNLIKKVNIDRVRTKIYPIDLHSNMVQQYKVVCSVGIQDGRKVLVISSPFVIRNSLYKSLSIKIKPFNQTQFLIEPQ